MSTNYERADPVAQSAASNYERVDPVAQSAVELRRKKRIKYIAYFAAFVVFQTLVITAFALTVMRIKNPKFRLRTAVIENLSYTPNTKSPSFNMRLNAEVTVKNTNFGHFRYENSTVMFAYGNITVGEAFIAKARVRARSTRKVNITVDMSSDKVLSNSNLGSDINSGMLSLTNYGRLSGRVHLMKLMKKRKSAQMNCSMAVNLAEGMIQDLKCN